MYIHCQHTFLFKRHVKVSFASDDPFKGYVMVGFELGVGIGLELDQQTICPVELGTYVTSQRC